MWKRDKTIGIFYWTAFISFTIFSVSPVLIAANSDLSLGLFTLPGEKKSEFSIYRINSSSVESLEK